MAIKSIGKIVLYEPMDNQKITELLAGSDTIIFEIERSYDLQDVPPIISAILPAQFYDVSIDYVESLSEIIDVTSWQHLENALIYKVNYDPGTKEFDLSNSYVRDVIGTSGTLTAINTSQVLKARFTTPGLDAPVYTEIDLPYGDPISSMDKSNLTAVGIELDLTVTGDLFSIKTQSVPFKVDFFKPSGEILNYVIDFNYKNKTIEI